MKKFSNFTGVIRATGILVLVAVAPLGSARAATFSVVHVFQGGSDGALPNSNLIADNSGNFYGTTMFGGAFNAGTLFELNGDGKMTVLYSFGGAGDGALPQGTIVMDKSDNVYGTTSVGGLNDDGTIFEFSIATGKETILSSFQGGIDGQTPLGGVIFDLSGNLVGTTIYGGGGCDCGTIFQWNADQGEIVSYSFAGGSDGANPYAGLVLDQSGNLVGTTSGGGSASAGTAFEFDSKGHETVLYSFQGGNDGAVPASALNFDAGTGNFYGTTLYGGGSAACSGGSGCGTLYALSGGVETVLHAFQGVSVDGAFPMAAVTIDASGNIYSSTCGTGQNPPNCNDYAVPGKQCAKGCSNGDVNQMTGNVPDAAAKFSVIHRFNGKGGSGPSAPMLVYRGTLYGTTEYGGAKGCKIGGSMEPGCGVLFKLTP